MKRSGASWLARVVVVTCCAMLPGCDNFIERVSQGSWHEVGTQRAPVARGEGEFVLTPIAAGSGDTVRAGDLVHVHLRTGPVISEFNAWLWTGDADAFQSLLELGPAGLRAAVIGKRVGERFRVDVEGMPCCNGLAVPMFGFKPAFGEYLLSRYDGNPWPSSPLYGRRRTDIPWARVDVLERCSAHLLERTADLKQWGYVLNMFDMHYPVSRSGRLVFAALQADCPAPRGVMRLEIGPLYRGGTLSDWDVSYASASRFSRPGGEGGVGTRIWTGLAMFVACFLGARMVARRRAVRAPQ